MIKTKPVFIILLLAVSILFPTGLVFLTLNRAQALSKETEIEKFDLWGMMAADEISRYFETHLAPVRTLAQVMSGFEDIAIESRRDVFNSMMNRFLESNDDYSGVFSVWYPDALDGRDAEYADTNLTDSSGQYISYCYRDENNSPKMGYYRDYRQILDNGEKAALSGPEFISGIDGGKNLAVTLTVPIVNGNGISGVAGIVIHLESLQEIVDSINPYREMITTTFNGDGIIITSLISHHPDIDLIGKSIDEIDSGFFQSSKPELAAAIRKGKYFSSSYYVPLLDKKVYIRSTPVWDIAGGNEKPWAVVMQIPEEQFSIQSKMMGIIITVAGIMLIISLAILIFCFFFFLTSKVEPSEKEKK